MANRKYDQRYNQGNFRGDESDDNSRHRNSAYDRTERDSNENIYNRYNRDEPLYGGGRDSNPGPAQDMAEDVSVVKHQGDLRAGDIDPAKNA